MSARVDVFISSTSRDLPEHRKQVMDACLRMGMFPIMVEHLPASDADAIEASLRMVDEAEIYLGIFAWRYGYIPAGHDISITEMEYNRAVERGIPRLIFVMHDEHSVKGSDVEKGPSAAKLGTFKERLLVDQVVNFFKSPEELRGHVIHGLVPHRVTDPRTLHSRYASVIPLPPEPYIAHPYTLLETGDLIGRQKELDMLTQWATQSDAAVFNFVVAIGGMGKSALTWKWFNDVAPDVMLGLAGRMWWSFYESDAGFENFIIRALAYVSRRPKEEIEEIPPSDREAQLLTILDRRPFLLVWDGFERTMLAYARMDAARMADDDLDEKTANVVAGVAGLSESAVQSFIEKHQLRKTADPRIGTLLRKMVRVRQSRILVSTRLYPAELQTGAGQTLPGAHAYFLRGLEDNDAVTLWQALGVTGSPNTLLPLFHTFDNYPLLIRALAGEVIRYRRAPGDFDQWRRANPDFNPSALPAVQVKSHVLAFALQGLDGMSSDLLRTVAAFQMPAAYDMLASLLVREKGPFSTENELDVALIDLEDRGLVGWDKRANRYDLHPIVRGVTWTGLSEGDKRTVYRKLHGYFETIQGNVPPLDQITQLEDLTPVIELFNTLIQLERYDEAFFVFRDRLSRILRYRIGAARTSAELLESFFPEGLGQLPPLGLASMQTYIMNALALTYRYIGQPAQAARLHQLSGDYYVSRRDLENASISFANMSAALNLIGALYNSEKAARDALLFARQLSSTDTFPTVYETSSERRFVREANSLLCLGLSLASKGDDKTAEVAFRRAQKIYKLEGHVEGQWFANVYSAQQALWKGASNTALVIANNAWGLSELRQNESEGVHSARLQGEGHLKTGNIEQASERLYYALTRARAMNIIEQELPSLVGLAVVALRLGNLDLAREHLDTAWEGIKRGKYTPIWVDALNVLAQIESDEGNSDASIEAATKAYQLAWCDGPPYAYHWGLEAAKKHLDEFGATYPEMPPFDPSKYEMMPEVEIGPPDEKSIR